MTRFFPYPTLTDRLELVAQTQVLDGDTPTTDMLAVRRSIDLSVVPDSWRRATFQLRLDLPPTVPNGVTGLQATLTLNCPATNLRIGVPMLPAARIGSFVGELTIEAGAFAGKAKLTAVVSGTIDDVPNRYFAQSHPWNVWLSAPETPQITGDLLSLIHI